MTEKTNDLQKMIETDNDSWKPECWNHPEMKRTIQEMIPEHISPLCNIIKVSVADPLVVYDIGGGNGQVAKAIRDALKPRESQIYVFDIDANKFPIGQEEGISFKQLNVRDGLPYSAGRFPQPNGMICRYVLHHNSPTEQRRIIQSWWKNTIPFSITDICFSDNHQRDRMQEVFDWVSEETGTNKRYWLTEDEVKKDIIGEVQQSLLSPHYQFSRNIVYWNTMPQEYVADGFIKNRFNLSEPQLQHVRTMIGKQPLQGLIYTTVLITDYTKKMREERSR